MKAILTFSILLNILLFGMSIRSWIGESSILSDVMVTVDYPTYLYPKEFTEEEKIKINKYLPLIEKTIEEVRPSESMLYEETLFYDPIYVRDVTIFPEHTVVEIEFFRSLSNSSYILEWNGHHLNRTEIWDDFIPRKYTFNNQDQLVPLTEVPTSREMTTTSSTTAPDSSL